MNREHAVIMYDERPNELAAVKKSRLKRNTHSYTYTNHHTYFINDVETHFGACPPQSMSKAIF